MSNAFIFCVVRAACSCLLCVMRLHKSPIYDSFYRIRTYEFSIVNAEVLSFLGASLRSPHCKFDLGFVIRRRKQKQNKNEEEEKHPLSSPCVYKLFGVSHWSIELHTHTHWLSRSLSLLNACTTRTTFICFSVGDASSTNRFEFMSKQNQKTPVERMRCTMAVCMLFRSIRTVNISCFVEINSFNSFLLSRTRCCWLVGCVLMD